MYAIIETGGKQYRVQEGDKIVVEKLAVEEGQEVAFERVLTVVKDGEVLVGAPVVAGAKVVAKVVEHGKGKKILFFKKKKKKA